MKPPSEVGYVANTDSTVCKNHCKLILAKNAASQVIVNGYLKVKDPSGKIVDYQSITDDINATLYSYTPDHHTSNIGITKYLNNQFNIDTVAYD